MLLPLHPLFPVVGSGCREAAGAQRKVLWEDKVGPHGPERRVAVGTCVWRCRGGAAGGGRIIPVIPGPSAGMVSGASESIRSVRWGKGMVEVTSCFVMEKYSCERGFWLFWGCFYFIVWTGL